MVKIWGFPKIGIPPNHPFIDRFSKPTMFEGTPIMENPMSFPSHIAISNRRYHGIPTATTADLSQVGDFARLRIVIVHGGGGDVGGYVGCGEVNGFDISNWLMVSIDIEQLANKMEVGLSLSPVLGWTWMNYIIHYHTISINPSANDARAVLPLLRGRIRSAGLGPVIPKDGIRCGFHISHMFAGHVFMGEITWNNHFSWLSTSITVDI